MRHIVACLWHIAQGLASPEQHRLQKHGAWSRADQLCPDDRQEKRRFDVYVCTAAERGYALEAWRLLDSEGDIIPEHFRHVRVICVGSQKKELRRVFRIQSPIKYQSGGIFTQVVTCYTAG